MKVTKRRLRNLIQQTLVEMPVSKNQGYFSRNIDKEHPHLLELAHEIDSLFQSWDINANVQLFNSGYIGLKIQFQDNSGKPQKWLVVDQPGKVGMEDQTMGYIFFGPGGPIQKSNAWIWEQVPYLGRKFGDTNTRDDARKEIYNDIIDEIDAMLRSPIGLGGESLAERAIRSIIRNKLIEAIDAVDTATGEVLSFKDDNDDGWEPTAPEAAWPDLVKRLGLNPEFDGGHEGVQSYALSGEDWTKLRDETQGKQGDRELKKLAAQHAADKERLDVDNLMDRAREWARTASQDYMADNRAGDQHAGDLQDVAWDLASAAKYEFLEDEWDELLWHFDDDERQVIEFIADSMG